MALVLTPMVFEAGEDGAPSPQPGIAFFAVLVIFLLGVGFYNLIKSYKKAAGRQKIQLRFVLVGLVGSFSLIFLTNFLAVVIFNYTNFLSFGAAYTLIFSTAFAYAIFRHHLFDVRTAIARSLAYIFSVALLMGVYASLAFGVVENIFDTPRTSASIKYTYTILAVLLALTFQPIKTYFDKVTDKIFFRNNYDLEKTVERLGDATVDETNINQIGKNAQTILSGAIHPGKLHILILSTSNKKYNSVLLPKDSTRNPLNDNLPILAKYINSNYKKTDVIRIESEKNLELRCLMEKLDINMIIQMRAAKHMRGVLLVGSKQNGSMYTRKDLQLLNTASDELALAIQNALRFEEIRDFNQTLQEKVDEATAKLRRTNARLRELDDAKDEFVSMASHQLRTPLTSVKGYLSMVLEGDAGKLNQEQKKFLEEAYNGAQRMVFLIGDFLNVSRIKTGKFMLEFAEANLAHMIEDEVTQLRITAETRNLNFVYEVPGEFPTVRLDENKIRQVAMNLIDNAIFYTKPGGTIKVEVYVEGGDIVFRVRDDGIGVPLKEQKNLFEKFYRAENARKERPDGTGLGLFMIKKVVLAHGGSIIFESKEGKGSTFGFRLPVKPVNVKPQENPLKIAR